MSSFSPFPASCFLQIWKYMEKFKQCECSVCGSLIFNLVPHPSALIHPGEEVTKILEEISKYNRQNMVGGLASSRYFCNYTYLAIFQVLSYFSYEIRFKSWYLLLSVTYASLGIYLALLWLKLGLYYWGKSELHNTLAFSIYGLI